MKITIFCDVMPHKFVDRYQCFKTISWNTGNQLLLYMALFAKDSDSHTSIC